MIFEITCKFLIVFVRLILEKVETDGFTGPRQEMDIRCEFGLKVTLKDFYGANRDFCSQF